MDKLVEELKALVPFKETTDVGDIVLIAAVQPQMLVYARVCTIERDETRKEEWWHLGMDLLSVPPQHVTWTLRTPQFTGQETFTMGGEARFIKAVQFDNPAAPVSPPPPKEEKKRPIPLRVVK